MTALTSAELRIGDRVKYIPNHAFDDASHPDCGTGTVKAITCDATYVQFGDACPVSVRADELILNISETA